MNEDLNQAMLNAINSERKIDRRWRNIRFFISLAFFIILVFFIAIPDSIEPTKHEKTPYVAKVSLTGVILPKTNFSANAIAPLLLDAFKDPKAKGVLLEINSPGGSPVQASIIHDQILFLKKKYHKKVVVLGDDSLASGAYLIATAADKIYTNKDTVTGSIGVIMNSFGLTDAIKKLGITRRVYTSGNNKNRLDPFKPASQADIEKIKSILNVTHQNFIQDVVNGRKNKLNGNPKELFSGDFWVGEQAVKLGLIDGIGNQWEILQKEFNVNRVKNYSLKPSLLEQLSGNIETALHLPTMSEASPLLAQYPQ